MVGIGLLTTENPPTALVMALAPVLAASGLQVAAAFDDLVAFDIDRRAAGNLLIIPGSGPGAAERLPAERVFWIGEPPFSRPPPVGRTLGKARLHEVVALLNGRANGSSLHKAVLETGAFILAGLKVCDATTAGYAVDGALRSGTAAERFAMVFGDQVLSDPGTLAPLAAIRRDVIAPRRGSIAGWSAGGLRAAMDVLGPGGAIGRISPAGTATGPNKPVARVYATDEQRAERAVGLMAGAVQLG